MAPPAAGPPAGCPTDDGRYEYLQPLGQGSYAMVALALDRHTGRRVAVKRTRGAFADRTDALYTYRELLLLAKLSAGGGGHHDTDKADTAAAAAAASSHHQGKKQQQQQQQHRPNLVRLIDVLLPPSYRSVGVIHSSLPSPPPR